MTALGNAICAILMASVGVAGHASAKMSREQALNELKVIKSRNGARLTEIERKIKALVGPAASESSLNVNINELEIETLALDRQEYIWRQDLIDRLTLQIDTRFKGGDLRQFLSDRLVDMAKTDLLESGSRQNLWKQMTYLSQTLRQIPERGENIIGFIDGYLKTSTFKKPLRPDEYLRSREYSNGGEHVAAVPAPKDQVGELVEERLQELEGRDTPSPSAN